MDENAEKQRANDNQVTDASNQNLILNRPTFSPNMPSLHVDLLNTTLDDFIEHLKPEIKLFADLALPAEAYGKWKTRPRQLEEWERDLFDPSTTFTDWILEAANGDIHVLIMTKQRGAISCRWLVYYPAQQRSGKGDFTLTATHYRRDRLNIVMWEDLDVVPIIGDMLLDWLKRYWRDGVDDLLKRGAPPPASPDESPIQNPQWQPRSEADRWFIAQYFDVHKEKKAIGNLQPEWIERRIKEGGKVPDDPNNSLSQLVIREKRQRDSAKGE